MEPTSPPFCLIGGTGRSGTTILRRIFERHPHVGGLTELRFPIDPDGLIDFYLSFANAWSPYWYDAKLKRLLALLRRVTAGPQPAWLGRLVHKGSVERLTGRKTEWRYLGLRALPDCPSFGRHVDALEAELSAFTYAGTWTGMAAGAPTEMHYHRPLAAGELAGILGTFWRNVAADTVAHQGATHFLEKNTWNILFFDHIRTLVPAAKLVHIHRDPRDVVASYTGQRWVPQDPVQAAQVCRDLLQQWWDVRARVPAECVLEVALEDLIAEPERVTRQICAFWDLPWHESLLSTPLDGGNVGRWRDDIPGARQADVQAVLAAAIEVYGRGDG